MKLQFKHQMFQAEAAKAVCDVFSGQPKTTPTYLIDKGLSQRNFRQIKIGDGVLLDEEEVDFTGYKNGKIRIPNSDILNNLQQIQRSLQIGASAGVFAHLIFIHPAHRKVIHSPLLSSFQKMPVGCWMISMPPTATISG